MLPSRFMNEFLRLSFLASYPDLAKVRDLLESVYQAGMAANPNQDAKRWRRLEHDLGEMRGKVIEHVRVTPQFDPRLPIFGSSIDLTYTVKDMPKRELCIRWLDEGEAPTLKSMLDNAIEKEAKRVQE